jgi:heterotetrameric sarcosine oxidase gamma subunit
VADLSVAPLALAPRSALADILVLGRHGRSDGPPGIIVSERGALCLASLITRKGQADTLAALMKSAYGLDLPTAGRSTDGLMPDGRSIRFLSAGPGQFLAIAEGAADFATELMTTLGRRAMIADQGDGRCVLRVGGPKARNVLAKGFTIDLHPRVFKPGDTALTQAAHIGVQLWQLDAAPTYEIAFFRSLAASFWSWLTASAAEFGYEVVPDKS